MSLVTHHTLGRLAIATIHAINIDVLVVPSQLMFPKKKLPGLSIAAKLCCTFILESSSQVAGEVAVTDLGLLARWDAAPTLKPQPSVGRT